MMSSQKRATQNYRSRLGARGMARFEVLGRDTDRELIRSLARKLAESGPQSDRLRAAVHQSIAGEPPRKGGILNALLRSPMAGDGFSVDRPLTNGRDIDL